MLKFLISLFFFCCFIQASIAQTWTTIDTSNSGLVSNEVRSIFIADNNIKWFGTNDGLSSYDDNLWNTFRKDGLSNTLINNHINNISGQKIEDDHYLWIATDSGLTKALIIDADSLLFLENYNQENSGLVNNQVLTADIDTNSVYWFGTDSGASSFENGNWRSYTVENYWIFFDKITDIDIDPNNFVYLATEGEGVSRLKMDPVDGVTGASAINTIWAGYNDPEGNGLASDSIYSILIEPNGNQWYGTNKGVSLHTSFNTRLDWKTFDTSNGLINNFIQVIHQDKNGVMWFGTKNGLTRFDGSSWTNFTKSEGLASNNILSINSDNENIWIGTDAGISKIDIISGILQNKVSIIPKNSSIRNYPNPFNGNTFIEFSVDRNSNIILVIYNINGQRVRQLKNEPLLKGNYKVNWNGLDDFANNVATGIYFAALYIDGIFHQQNKILYIK